MKPITWNDRLRYRFDNYMAKGTAALIGGLAALSLAVILLAASLISLANITPEGGESLTFVEAAWESLMRTLDSGTMGGDTGWTFRIVMFAVTLGGVFIISSLIGVLTSGLEGKMDEMRKGRSRVIESDHTVILGWSSLVFSIISELITANANLSKSCIVILGDKDKVEMEEEIRNMIGDTGRTRIVCRTGSPIDLNDLEIVNLPTARSIIILSPETDNPDAEVIKTMLAITNNASRRPEPYHIVAEIRDPKNVEVARMVGRDEVEIVMVGDLISRIIAQTCRQSGLSVVYTELLDFGGDEIYFKSQPGLYGKTFGDALLAYEDSVVIGIYRNGQAALNPAMTTLLQSEDQLIVISEDDDTIHLSGNPDLQINEGAIQSRLPEPDQPEHTLILGWNWRAPTIINELDNYVASGSIVTIVANYNGGEAEIRRLCPDLKNQTVSYQQGDTTDRRTLDELQVEIYQHIIVLSYNDSMSKQEADSLTLIALLHLRDIAEKGGHDLAIVSEMLDLRNRALAEVTQADDFIVSDKLISLMLSQVSENKGLNAVFADIFDPDGSEIYLKPAANYVTAGTPVNFYTVVEAARRRGEVALGYRVQCESNDPSKSYGVKINPDKSKAIIFAEQDRIVVLAEE
jgi:voltage-gated potassium channel Kch